MKELFRERDFTKIGYFASILESRGVATLIRNENMMIIEVPIPDLFPSLCVVNDEDYGRAIEILREHASKDRARAEEEIDCPHCQEKSPGNFEICWSCGGEIQPV